MGSYNYYSRFLRGALPISFAMMYTDNVKFMLYIAGASVLAGVAAKYLGLFFGMFFSAYAEESMICRAMSYLFIAIHCVGQLVLFVAGWALPILIIFYLFN